MSNLQASLRIPGPDYHNLDELALRLNELFLHNIKRVSFISLFLVRIDENSGILQYCNAGHNPAVHWKAATKTIHWLKPTGPAIGLSKNADFKSKDLLFETGDLLLLYSDGLIEAESTVQGEFGKQRVESFIRNNQQLSANDFLVEIRETVRDFCEKFNDDVTLVVIKG